MVRRLWLFSVIFKKKYFLIHIECLIIRYCQCTVNILLKCVCVCIVHGELELDGKERSTHTCTSLHCALPLSPVNFLKCVPLKPDPKTCFMEKGFYFLRGLA